MVRFARLATTLLIPLFIVWAVLDDVQAEEDNKKKGFKIFGQAREHAGAGEEAEPLRDYTFDFLTRTQPRGQKRKSRSNSKAVFPSSRRR